MRIILIKIQHLCAKNYVNHFTFIISFNLLNGIIEHARSYLYVTSEETRLRDCNLTKVTQPVSGELGWGLQLV